MLVPTAKGEMPKRKAKAASEKTSQANFKPNSRAQDLASFKGNRVASIQMRNLDNDDGIVKINSERQHLVSETNLISEHS